jgi:hypothetical protein
MNSSLESTPSWFVSRLSNEDAAEPECAGDGGEEADGGDVVADDSWPNAAAGMTNMMSMGVRHAIFILISFAASGAIAS